MSNLTGAQVCEILRPLKELEVSDANGWWQTILAEKLLSCGKTVNDMTVREVRDIVTQANTEFSRVSA